MIIVNMKRPENCENCPFRNEDQYNRDYCVALEEDEYLSNFLDEKPEKCPIVGEILQTTYDDWRYNRRLTKCFQKE